MFRRPTETDIPPALTPNGMRLYAIGDIHGRFDLLCDLMALIRRDAGRSRHRIIFLGDYIDRGPDSAAVLDYLVALQRDRGAGVVFLKGNHEQAMLDFIAAPEAASSWLNWGGREALESYGIFDPQGDSPLALRDQLLERLPGSHFRFLRDLDLHHREGDYVFVHAGLRPGRPLEMQSEQDLLWIREAFFRADPRGFQGACIVHGHTPVEDRPVDAGWRINVDTGAVWTGRLTAVVLDGSMRRFLWTAPDVETLPDTLRR